MAGPKWFQGPKKSRFQGPPRPCTPSDAPPNGCCTPQNHYVPRHINNIHINSYYVLRKCRHCFVAVTLHIRAAQLSLMFTPRNIYVTVLLANTLFRLCCWQILYLRRGVGDALGVFLKEEEQKQHSQISLWRDLISNINSTSGLTSNMVFASGGIEIQFCKL